MFDALVDSPSAQKTIVVSGHLVDRPDRAVPRFPQRLVGKVAERMSGVLDEWAVGPGTLVICGGARGADLIGAEQALARGARVLICLALPPDTFEQTSVMLPGTDWSERFRRVLNQAEVRQLPDSEGQCNVFAAVNEWMVRLARDIDPRPHALLLWDHGPGDGPGGTADLVHRLGLAPNDQRLRIIDPRCI